MTLDPLKTHAIPNAFGYSDIRIADLVPHLKDVPLVDVREPAEYSGPLGHIAGARLLPMSTFSIEALGTDPDQPVVLICRSGARSGRVAAALSQAGFRRVYNMLDGMLGWNEAGLPVERD